MYISEHSAYLITQLLKRITFIKSGDKEKEKLIHAEAT